ncbi:MAG TPA: OsmC family protein [Opitutaceae bacterium]|nr:OsmC family protein [Opitutaceae bacterium]
MVNITGDYSGDLHCTAVHGPSGNAISTDAPKDNQGRGEAFSPTDLVATAYATCVATTMAMAARKYGIELNGLRYAVTKEMAADAPRRIARLRLTVWLPPAARKAPAGVLEYAAHHCPVHLSLAPAVEKVIDFHWDEALATSTAKA